mmetsp:Transcript_56408/g.101106  ORF Transcript_56408/g.101106 Transcript_56408/m.101106 type:complete len:731 (-) Transcript_56408:176-2368(-)
MSQAADVIDLSDGDDAGAKNQDQPPGQQDQPEDDRNDGDDPGSDDGQKNDDRDASPAEQDQYGGQDNQRGGGGGRGRDDSRSPVRGGGHDRGRDGGGGGGRGGGDDCKLFVGQLPFDAEEDDIRDAFRRCGDIVNIQVIKDRETGKSRGFGFITFADPDDAARTLRSMDQAEIMGRPCKLGRAGKGLGRGGKGGGDRERERGGWQDSGRGGGGGGGYRDRGGGGRGGGGKGSAEPDKLFIGRLSQDTTEDDIRDKFTRIGDVVSVQIIKDHSSGESKGFGFIKFSRVDDAEEALKTMNDSDINGRSIRLERVGEREDDPRRGGRAGGRSMTRSRSGRRGGGGGYGYQRRDQSDSRSRTPPPRARPPDLRARRGPPPDGRDGRGDWRQERPQWGGRKDWQEGGRGGGQMRRRGQERLSDSREPLPRREARDGRRRSESRPAGGPKKNDAVQSAQIAFEDAQEAVRVAREEAAAAEGQLKKMEKVSQKNVQRKVADVSKSLRNKLEDNIAKVKHEAKSALSEALTEVEVRLQKELAEKIKEMKAEHTVKVEGEQRRIQKEQADKFEEDQKALTEAVEAKISEVEKQYEKDEQLEEYREAHGKAAAFAKAEEEKLQSAKRRLENLTGQEIRIEKPRLASADQRAGKGARKRPPEPRQGHYDRPPRDMRDGGRDGRRVSARDAPPVRDVGHDCARDAYDDEYTEYSEDFDEIEEAPPPRNSGRGRPPAYRSYPN